MPWQHTNPSPSLSTTLLEFPLCYYVHGRTGFAVTRKPPAFDAGRHLTCGRYRGREEKKELTPQRDTVWQTTKYSTHTRNPGFSHTHTHHSQSINNSKDVNISSGTTALLYTWTTAHTFSQHDLSSYARVILESREPSPTIVCS